MKRRNVLLGFGGLVAGTSLTLGSSAFTSVEAERSVTVEVAKDSTAFLAIDAQAEGIAGRSSEILNQEGYHYAEFRIPGSEDRKFPSDEPTDPDGIGKHSRYQFADLAVIRNQGTQEIAVFSEYDGNLEDIAIYDSADGNLLTNQTNSRLLETGEEFVMGLYIETGNADLGIYDETLTIIATDT